MHYCNFEFYRMLRACRLSLRLKGDRKNNFSTALIPWAFNNVSERLDTSKEYEHK